MKFNTLTALAFTLLLSTTALAQSAVRGMLVTTEKNTPVPGISITLLNSKSVRSAPVISGADGMFYIYDVVFGTYKVEVWTKGFKETPLVFDLKVTPESANKFVDVPLIKVKK